jgi:hypothetical protein
MLMERGKGIRKLNTFNHLEEESKVMYADGEGKRNKKVEYIQPLGGRKQRNVC